jgi:hypothetical protein
MTEPTTPAKSSDPARRAIQKRNRPPPAVPAATGGPYLDQPRSRPPVSVRACRAEPGGGRAGGQETASPGEPGSRRRSRWRSL